MLIFYNCLDTLELHFEKAAHLMWKDNSVKNVHDKTRYSQTQERANEDRHPVV